MPESCAPQTPTWYSEWHYLVRDIVGSLVASTDETGALEFQQGYDAFGKLIWRTGVEGNSSLGSGYTGHHDLAGQGLVSMKARLYDPELAGFINADPIMQAPLFSQSSNRYAYVFNNPLKYTDPTGMSSKSEDDPPEKIKADPAKSPIPGGGTYPGDQRRNLPHGRRFKRHVRRRSDRLAAGRWWSRS